MWELDPLVSPIVVKATATLAMSVGRNAVYSRETPISSICSSSLLSWRIWCYGCLAILVLCSVLQNALGPLYDIRSWERRLLRFLELSGIDDSQHKEEAWAARLVDWLSFGKRRKGCAAGARLNIWFLMFHSFTKFLCPGNSYPRLYAPRTAEGGWFHMLRSQVSSLCSSWCRSHIPMAWTAKSQEIIKLTKYPVFTPGVGSCGT